MVAAVLILAPPILLFAQLSFEIAAAPSVRLSVAESGDTLGPGYGGSVDMDVSFGRVPARVGVGVAAHGFAAPRSDIDNAFMLTPRLGAAYAPALTAGRMPVLPYLGISYRHYLAWHSFKGARHLTYRPTATVEGGVGFAVSPSVRLGPALRYDFIFDDRLRQVLELGLRASFAL